MKNILIIFLLTLFSSCSKDNIEKVSIYYIGCLGECPQLKLEIKSNLQMNYYGGYFSEKKGFYNGVVDKKSWKKIQDFLTNGDYRNLNKSYYLSSNEEMNVELVINSENGSKRVTGLMNHYPPEIKELLEFVLYKIPEWKMTKKSDTYKFDFLSDDYTKPMFPPKIIKDSISN